MVGEEYIYIYIYIFPLKLPFGSKNVTTAFWAYLKFLKNVNRRVIHNGTKVAQRLNNQ
jgi:hypothetical protein